MDITDKLDSYSNKLPLSLLQLLLLLKPLTNDGAFLVGGCVRDIFLDRVPKDFDIVTAAKIDSPEVTEMLQENGWSIKGVGEAFLVYTVSKNGESYEIANFRKESHYDGRRPQVVEIGTMEEDSDRRDFTMNAIYWNPLDQCYFDRQKGIQDIQNKTIRFIGKPKERIQEDYLRVFRLYRFAATLRFTIDKKSLKAAREYFTEAYQQTTPERVRNELERMVK